MPPRTVVCYICGREFGTSSIGIHEKQCARKWEDAESQKPPSERRPLPQRPDVDGGATRDEQNQAAREAYESQVMAHCGSCGRSFKDEATLQRHQRGCKGKVSKPGNARGAQAHGGQEGVQDLMSALFKIVDADHSGFIDGQEVEVALQALGKVGEMLGYDIDYSFAGMDADHSGGVDEAEFTNALMPMIETLGPKMCVNALHSLISEAESLQKLVSHRRDRGAGTPDRPGQGGRSGITQHAFVPKDVEPCPNCGRNFNPESMVIHLRTCGGAHGTSKIARSQLQGNNRKERTAFEAMHNLLRMSARDPKMTAKLRAAFNKLDMDGNGKLDRKEFEIVYTNVKWPSNMPMPSLDELMSQYDANHDGVLQYGEFERLSQWIISKPT
mmetsp:Transcript_14635/g.41832  ORF Transcript_14635/g.41832 Transcript_14635/m.41832 type:complete len:385 (+) Transcript_14635:3-1157(+)